MHKAHQNAAVDKKIRNSLRFSLLDGASFSVMLGSAESYFQAFAIFLKGTVYQVGIVYTIPVFIASIIQLHASSLLRWFKSRKNLTVLAGALRSLLFVPLILVYYLGAARVWVLLGIICLGFFLIFGLAFLGSIGSTIFLSLKYDVPYTEPPRDREGFFHFSVQMFRSNYGRFVLYNFSLYIGVFFAGPFFVPYMLKDLGFSYVQFMIATALVVLTKFVTLPMWGELSDRYGNKRILVLASVFISILPFLWMSSRAFWWICLIQAAGGLAWAGFDISALNFAYDVLPSEKVTRHTSYLIFYRGLAVFTGGLIGGLLIRHFSLFGSAYLGNLFLSGLFRVVVAIPFLFFLKEERSVEHISYRQLMFKPMSVGPRRGLQLFLIGKAKENDKTEQVGRRGRPGSD